MTVAKSNTTASAGTSVVSKKTKDNSSKDISVAVRIRPLSSDELNQGCNSVVQCSPLQQNVLHLGVNKQFEFSHVFRTDSSQESIYQFLVSPLLDSFFDGYNATVLAYGQTGSGKTFTMGTEFRVQDISPEHKGVLPRVMEEVFERVAVLENTSQAECTLSLSYLEILNEEIQDLLVPANSNLPIREDQKKGMIIAGLSEHRVKTLSEVTALLSRGGLHRATASTSMNSSSSRSHAICTLTIEQTFAPAEGCPHGEYKFSKFHLVDLAGSERAKKTKAQGDRFREGVNINKGLLALGNVIGALTADADGSSTSSGSTHIPYRDSKITRLLQDSLGGNSKTAMIACVSPADSNYDESNSTLKYAQRARKIQNKAVINRDAGDMEVSYLRQQVQLLQLQLLSGSSSLSCLSTGSSSAQVEKLQGRIDKLQILILDKQKKLNDMTEARDQWKNVALKAQHELEELQLQSSTQRTLEDKNSSHAMIQKLQALDDAQIDPIRDTTEEDVDFDLEDDENPLNVSTTSSYSGESETKLEMEDISQAISAKEEILQAIRSSDDHHMLQLQSQYEKKISHYETQIRLLEKQKRDYVQAKKTHVTKTGHQDQLKTLEAQVLKYRKDLVQLRKTQEESKRLKKMYQSGELRISSLQNDLLDMKTQRTSMQKKLRFELEKHRKDKRAKELQITQLQRQDQRKQYQYEKLEQLHKKQQHVLKRKTEEMATAQKRLRTLDSRKTTTRSSGGKIKPHMNTNTNTNTRHRTKDTTTLDLEQYIETQMILRTTQEAIAVEIQHRRDLSLELAKPETSLRVKQNLRQAMRHKALTIREMQEKCAGVEKSVSDPVTLRDAQEIITLLLDRHENLDRAMSIESQRARDVQQKIQDTLQREHAQEKTRLEQHVQELLTQVNTINALTNTSCHEMNPAPILRHDENDAPAKEENLDEEEVENLDDEDENLDDDEEEEEEEEENLDVDSNDSDSDYIDSPERKKNTQRNKSKRALNLSKEIDDLLDEEEEDLDEGMDCCNCVGRCITNCCPCKLRSVNCSVKCKCDEHKCTNQCSSVPPPVLVKKKNSRMNQSSNKENASTTKMKTSLLKSKTSSNMKVVVKKGKGLYTRDLNQNSSTHREDALPKAKKEAMKKLWSR